MTKILVFDTQRSIRNSLGELLEHEGFEVRLVGDVDGVVAGSEKADQALLDYARENGKKVLDNHSPEEEGFFDNYDRFYEELF